MQLTYNDVLDCWKNFLKASTGNISFEQMIVILNQKFSEHYHQVKYSSIPTIYMEHFPNCVYEFIYDIILPEDDRFNHDFDLDIQLEITVKMTDLHTRVETTMCALKFMHKYCNPECRAILEKATIEFL